MLRRIGINLSRASENRNLGGLMGQLMVDSMVCRVMRAVILSQRVVRLRDWMRHDRSCQCARTGLQQRKHKRQHAEQRCCARKRPANAPCSKHATYLSAPSPAVNVAARTRPTLTPTGR